MNLEGTNFQIKVWNELKKIPSGEVRTYKQIAESIGCLLYTSPSPRDQRGSRMPSSA